jgi:hypothetical protein
MTKVTDSFQEHRSELIPFFVAAYRMGALDRIFKDQDIDKERLNKACERISREYGIEVSAPDDRGARKLKIAKAPGEKFTEAMEAIERAAARHKMLYASVLMNMTSAVELFFSRLLHIHFALHPEAVSGKDKLFSFEDLAAFDSVADARQHYTLTKIEDLLRGAIR